ncbi:MAG: DsbA family protein, partial [Polyangiales bacterium]
LTGKSSGSSETATIADDGVERYKVPVTDAQPAKGPADALVTIVEVSDFECPFCSRVLPTISRVLNDYEGKVRVVWRNNPLPMHPNAPAAAQAALEAYAQGGAKKFWQMHDLMFNNQRSLKRADLEGYAKQIGLNMSRFRKALDSNAHQSKVKDDQAMAAKFGARGTPAFFINGRLLSGAQPYEKFKEIIDEEIKRAEQLVATGIDKAKVYEEITKNALDAAKPPEAPTAPPQARKIPDPKAVYKVPVNGQPQKGPNDALITIVEFSDFECPFCQRAKGTVDAIIEKYGKDVRVVFMNNPLPFHAKGLPSAQAALEAYKQGGAKKFWQMHDILFENRTALDRADLEGYAKKVGLNLVQFKKALDTNAHAKTVQSEQNLARSLGASSVPNFYINGRNLRGAQPLPAFITLIEEELAKAKAMVKSGVARKDLYAKIIANGATTAKLIDAPSAPKPRGPDPNMVYKIPVPKKVPFKGGANAKVVIQEFSDFQCPFCSRVLPSVQQVMKEYGNKVKLVWRHHPLPMHPDAPLAHEASAEVFRQGGSKKFWAYHDLLFANQRALSRADLEKYAQQVGGINLGEFKKALDDRRHKALVQSDLSAPQKAGAQIGTPSFFINGKLLQGAQPYAKFKEAIDAALKGS